MTDLNTYFVQSNNDTMDWCKSIMSDNDHYRYRPMNEVIACRNNSLTRVMHYRNYQQEY